MIQELIPYLQQSALVHRLLSCFGDVSGSGAAAMRYTEARIAKYTEDGMKDLKYCQFVPNFDGTEKEPVHLPFLIPNILTSGTTGIAVGMATNG